MALTVEQVTNLYLYGRMDRPTDLTDESLVRASNETSAVEVDLIDFMTNGPGRFANPVFFEIVQLFFSYAASVVPPGTYNEQQLIEKMRDGNITVPINALISQPQSLYADGTDDYGARAYIWNTLAYEILDNPTNSPDGTLFVINADGSRHIENLRITPFTTAGSPENFDFEGGDVLTGLGNPVLRRWVDPSGIGRKVNIEFFNPPPAIALYTMADYENDRQFAVRPDASLPFGLVDEIRQEADGLFADGSTRFLDADNRPIVYGTTGGDQMYADQAMWAPLSGHAYLGQYTGNGIAYVAGGGDDTIVALDTNDALYGGKGRDTLDGRTGADDMYGGADDDTYIVDNIDDKVVEKAGEGKDLVKSSVHHILADHVEELELTGSEDLNGTGNDLKNVIRGNDGLNNLMGRGGDDEIHGNDGDDWIWGGEGKDRIFGGDDDDTIFGDANNDDLYGGDGTDTLYGGGDRDFLDGGEDADRLEGGDGHDFYRADSQDTIMDTDGYGHVHMDGFGTLTGGTRKDSDPQNEYRNGALVYVLNGTTLVVNGGLIIEQFRNGDLGIHLDTEPEDDEAPDTDDAEHQTSPIVLDLDGDGIETTPLDAVYFDFDGNKLAEKTAWVGADDGLLALDRNGDGRINDGSELFGNNTRLANGQLAANGFQALAELDANADGIINNQDAAYATLRVWRDVNGNGYSEASELITLEQAGVVSIGTGYSESTVVDGNQNEHRQVGTIVLENGTASTATDVWFRIDTARRISTGGIELAADIMRMPDARGFGNVYDLREAMALDAGLKGLVEQYIDATDAPARDALLDELIYRWAGAANVDPYSRDPTKVYGHVMDARQLVTLENLVGHSYLGTWCWGERDPNPHGQAAPLLIAEFLEFKRFTAAQILSQTVYGDALLGILRSAPGSNAQSIEVDWTALAAKLNQLQADNAVDMIAGIVSVVFDLGTYAPRYRAERDAAFLAMGAANPALEPFLDFSTRVGSAGVDTLNGASGGSEFHGLAGDDRLYGQSSADIYHFARGQGQDTILDRGGVDKIVFGAGISQSDLVFTRDTTTVWIQVKNADGSSAGSLQIDNFFDFDGTTDFGMTESIQFADGSTLGQSQIIEILTSAPPSTGDDYIFGGAGNDIIDTLAGNDNLHGLDGNDQLRGGAGNDMLLGDDGNDILTGGSGDDSLIGGRGSDDYVFAPGHGHDVIDNAGETGGKIDRIVFQSGIAPGDIVVARVGDDLVLRTSSSSSITVRNYFRADGSSGAAIDQIVFADGASWSIADVKLAVLNGGAGNDVLSGYASSDVIHGAQGNDLLYGYGGDDTLSGDAGDDQLQGHAGNDTLYGGEGVDVLSGGQGNDVLKGGAGNDLLEGGGGSDVYLFERGDGQDTISSYDDGIGRFDVLQFGQAIDPADVTARRSGDNLVLTFQGGTDQITVSQYFAGEAAGAWRLDQIRFSDTAQTVWDIGYIKATVLVPTSGDDTLMGYADNESLAGGEGNDLINGGGGNDLLQGEAGEDTLYGGSGQDSLRGGDDRDFLNGDAGDDVLQGGKGNDSLRGGEGSDEYRFELGDGQDTIDNYDGSNGRIDVLTLGTGISPGNTLVRRLGDSLVLLIGTEGDQVTISNYFQGDGAGNYRIDEIRFVDVPNAPWSVQQVREKVLAATDGDDVLQGYASNDLLAGAAGNDSLRGNAGDDVLDGQVGDDWLYGGDGQDSLAGGTDADTLHGDAGDDRLAGGEGDDVLDGGAGSDVYVFNLGDGWDTINNLDYSEGRVDVLSFGVGIGPADVQARRVNSDLVLSVAGGADKVTVYNYFAGEGAAHYQIDQVRFTDAAGTVWDVAAVKQLVLASTSTADVLQGYSGSDTFSGGDGNDSLSGYDGNDTLAGDAGNDLLYGGAGNDALSGGMGADMLSGDAGDDTLYGGADNDVVRGGSGIDHLSGGTGNDQLDGGEGQDHYYFAAGDGQDAIIDMLGLSTIHLSALSPAQTYLRREGTTLVMRFIGEQDTIRLSGFFDSGTELALRGLVVDFGGGTQWSLDAAAVDATVLLGTSLDDVIDGNTLGNILHGLAGNDILRGSAGADTVDGGADDDALYGETGNDVLVGGEGDDWLDGGAGADGLAGGTGDDVYVVDDVGDLVSEVVDAGMDLVYSSVSQVLSDNVEQLTLTGSLDIHGTGNGLNNVLSGNDGSNQLAGLGGNDVLYGNAGVDRLDGGDGDDELDGGSGEDHLSGGAGDDLYRVDEAGDIILELAGEGLDSVESTAYAYRLSANVENLTLVEASGALDGEGNALDNVLAGNSGGNRLDGGSGADVLVGGHGDDTYVVDQTGDQVIELADEGVDTMESSINYVLGATLENLTLLGSADLEATGNAGANVIRGNLGNNHLDGAAGADTLYGGEGDDLYVVVSASDRVYEYVGEGIDTVERVFETNLVLDNNVENLILGSGITTGNGNALDNTITGSASANSLGGWDGGDVLFGLDGDDNLFGGTGADILYGGNGADYLDGGESIDHLEGSAGNDIYVTDDSADVVVETAGAGTDQVQTTASYVLSANIENLFLMGSSAIDGTGNELDNYLAGNSAANLIYGGGGSDTIVAGAGNDTLYGGTGDDKYVFDASSGSDVIDNSDAGFDGVFFTSGVTRERLTFGRDGDDLLIFVDASATPSVRVLNHFLGGDAAIDYVQPDGGYYLTAAEINQIVAGGSSGGQFDQVITGTAAGEQLVGSAGKDLIEGLGGADTLFGMGGNDTLRGGDGNDYLAGGNGNGSGSGNDVLEGGIGNDTLRGEDGSNTLTGGAGDDQYVYGGGIDVIDNTGGGTDWLIFQNGIATSQLALVRDGDDLVITVNGNASQRVTVTDHFLGGDMALDYLQPASGSALNTAAINALVTNNGGGGDNGGGTPGTGNDADYPSQKTGTTTGEQIVGTSGRDLIKGLGGADTLFGMGADDKLDGGDGDDYLSGGNGGFSGSGNDILIGGAGDDQLVGEDGADTLFGGSGNDTYFYAAGSGADTIDNTGGGTDWLYLDGIDRARLTYHREGDDLIVRVDGDAGQQMRVLGHFLGGERAIAYVQPGDGGFAISAATIADQLTPLGSASRSASAASLTAAPTLDTVSLGEDEASNLAQAIEAFAIGAPILRAPATIEVGTAPAASPQHGIVPPPPVSGGVTGLGPAKSEPPIPSSVQASVIQQPHAELRQLVDSLASFAGQSVLPASNDIGFDEPGIANRVSSWRMSHTSPGLRLRQMAL